MVAGLRDALSSKVNLVDDAERVVFALRPNLIKGWVEGQNPALLTMWETNWLPPEFSEYLQLFDTVIVPSLHNWELFSQFHDNVRVIPLGVDRDVWHPKERPQNDKFKILCGGSEWYRKGLDVVLKVFLEMNLPDAELHIKIVPPYLCAPKNLVYPNVVIHNKWMTVEDEADLVRSADCFISVSRGEGFGLMPLQAMRELGKIWVIGMNLNLMRYLVRSKTCMTTVTVTGNKQKLMLVKQQRSTGTRQPTNCCRW